MAIFSPRTRSRVNTAAPRPKTVVGGGGRAGGWWGARGSVPHSLTNPTRSGGELERVRFVGRAHHRRHRAECFFVERGHAGPHLQENRGRVEGSAALGHGPAERHLATGLHGSSDLTVQAIAQIHSRQRPDLRRGIPWVAELRFGHAVDEALLELG